MQPDFSFENKYKNLIVAGFDEAGRGPLAGPVVAACAVLDQENYPCDINDSKKLSKNSRKKIFLELQKTVKFGVGVIDEKTIDQVNIFEATKMAMFQAYLDLKRKYQIAPQAILVDGNFIPFKKQDQITDIVTIVKGDQKSLSIAAASIIAKEIRDEIMLQLHNQCPQYGFNKHAGYATKLHIAAIKEHGASEFHRRSFEPIKSIVNASC